MQTKRTYNVFGTFYWSRKNLIKLLLWNTAVVSAYELLGWTWLDIPWLPIATIGVAVAFFIGFKNNSSYGRMWEARMIWGAIVNSSRTWGVMVKDFITNQFTNEKLKPEELKDIHRELLYRHVAWLAALRHQLRTPRSWEHKENFDIRRLRKTILEYNVSLEDEIDKLLDDKELEILLKKSNRATQLLAKQSERLRELREKHLIDDFRHMEMENLVKDFYTQQGRCERIKNFPFPRQYATFNVISVSIFVLLLPLGMLDIFLSIDQFSVWHTIYFSTLVGWIFTTAEMIGDASENPFAGEYNDIPITSLSRTIEIDLREMLDETDIPEPIGPVNNYLW